MSKARPDFRSALLNGEEQNGDKIQSDTGVKIICSTVNGKNLRLMEVLS